VQIEIKQVKALGSTTGWLIWPVSTHLCKFIFNNPSMFAGKKVLEFGSGTGLVGIACNIAGAELTLLTDLFEGLPMCQENVNFNRTSLKSNSKLVVEELFWGNKDHMQSILTEYGEMNVLIGSDVIYHQSPEALAALVDSIVAMSNPNTTFVLAYEYRECMIEDEMYFFSPLRPHFRHVVQFNTEHPDRWIYVYSGFIH